MDYLRESVKQQYSVQSIRQNYLSGKKSRFVFFWKPDISTDGSLTESCLGQWWKSDFELDGQKYICMEQFMMSSKAKLFGDEEINKEILRTSNPKTIKSLGRAVRNFDNDIWDRQKFTIVYYGNLLKFSQNKELKEYLLSTKNKILVEASPMDAIWGIKMSAENIDSNNPVKWRGQNLLGCALMQVRDELLK